MSMVIFDKSSWVLAMFVTAFAVVTTTRIQFNVLKLISSCIWFLLRSYSADPVKY